MKTAVVAIGVDKVRPPFVPLQAAAAGAQKFAAWGESQGFDVFRLCDSAGARVTVAEVTKTIQQVIDAGVYLKLFVYFSGHGVLLAPGSEVWLLSDAPDVSGEAVNLTQSLLYARFCGLEHVVFISDACRTPPTFFGTTHALTPVSIFPFLTPRPGLPPIDVFYATLPGSPAFEVKAANGYEGGLTNCVLEAFNGKVPALVQELNLGGKGRWVVGTSRMKNHLERVVPEFARANGANSPQDPDIRIESTWPAFFSDVTGSLDERFHIERMLSQPRRMVTEGIDAEKPAKELVSALRWEAASDNVRTERKGVSPKKAPAKKAAAPKKAAPAKKARNLGPSRVMDRLRKRSTKFTKFAPGIGLRESPSGDLSGGFQPVSERSRFSNASAAHIEQWLREEVGAQVLQNSRVLAIQDAHDFAANRRRQSLAFEGCAISRALVVGGRLDGRAVISKGPLSYVEISEPDGSRRHPLNRQRALLVQFQDGRGACFPLFEGHTGAVVVDESGICAMSFLPWGYGASKLWAEIASRHVHVAALASQGSIKFSSGQEADEGARYLRMLKHVDPVLAVFAANAYVQAGNFKGLASVYSWMRSAPGPMPFDVALLASQFAENGPERLDFSPWMPLLTQDWLMLGRFEQELPEILREVRRYLLPSLFTTFSSEGMARLFHYFEGSR